RGVMLKGKWVPVDPRAWIAAFHIGVRVGIGHGTLVQRIATLAQTATAQQQAIKEMGPNNPLCTLGQLRNTLSDMLVASGIQNVGRYWNELPQDFKFQPPPPPPDPNLIAANAEGVKAQADKEKADNDRYGKILEDDRLRDEARAKAVLDALDIAGKYGTQFDLRSIAVLFDRNPASVA